MEITEVRVFLKDSPDKKLRAYVTVTFDNAFVVRNIKVIEGTSGLFIAMPSRKIKQPCPKCGFKNEMRSKYCNQCAAQLPLAPRPVAPDAASSANAQLEHKDIAHPITQSFREYLQKRILEAYEQEKAKAPSSSGQATAALD
ncbi:MAG: septation protein SpoVG family protein [Candidatus Omnitrophica bacterium]|nr:septation protein SpoVG family protein [Candidatus Omnitrophota bacterium]MDD5592968.1 septation protein SpoVG family protein [Candidatus Omnitrophota bacterium]